MIKTGILTILNGDWSQAGNFSTNRATSFLENDGSLCNSLPILYAHDGMTQAGMCEKCEERVQRP